MSTMKKIFCVTALIACVPVAALLDRADCLSRANDAANHIASTKNDNNKCILAVQTACLLSMAKNSLVPFNREETDRVANEILNKASLSSNISSEDLLSAVKEEEQRDNIYHYNYSQLCKERFPTRPVDNDRKDDTDLLILGGAMYLLVF